MATRASEALVKKDQHLYRQIADELRDAIRDGRYKPGERLPSTDDLAAHHKVHRITVLKSLKELRNQGLTRSVSGQGTYVADNPPAARAPQSRRVFSVGLVSHVLHSGAIGPYHAMIISGIQAELAQVGGVLVVAPGAHVEQQSRILDLLRDVELDAVIYLGPFDPTALRELVAHGPPAVIVDFQLRGLAEDFVLVDNRSGGYQAVEHLLQLGHRDLALILGPDDQPSVQERLAGVEEALEQHRVKIPAERRPAGDFTRAGGERAMQRLLSLKRPPTAVFCMNDEMAIGALRAIQTGPARRVPDDISLIGFDDIPSATATFPHLSTIRIETALMGRTAVQRLLARRKSGVHTATTVVVPTQLIVRDSTARHGG